MKSYRGRILQLVLAAIMMTGCMGCGGKETGKEDQDSPQEVVNQDDREDHADNVQEGEAEEDDPFEYGEFPEPLPLVDEDLFHYEIWETEKTKISTPGGIIFDGEDLLVCDTGNHCVVRLTTDGEWIESYGELGSEAGNFVTPTAILLHENEIYVLDSGNMRVQIFDMDMNAVGEILFEGSPLPSNGKYNDMAIAGDGTIYITADSCYGDGLSLFYIENGELCVVPEGCLGYLAEQDGVVYTADKWRYYRDNKGYGWKPGKNWIYQVERTGLQKVGELPYMYAPADFAVRDNEIYAVSTVWGKMNRFSMEGEVSETMFYKEEVQANDMYLSVQDENTFYVADTQGYLYKVFCTEGEE